jgi:UDP-N-acetylmuramoyl-tripeptide--D-alanyl-D-alanine ligase
MKGRQMTLADIVEGITGVRRPTLEGTCISGTVIDSRSARSGTAFVALKGEHGDGHHFVAEAFDRGAVVAVTERTVDARGTAVDLTRSDWDILGPASGPFILRTDSSLRALNRMAAFWRQQHDVRVIGITGSVGKTTTKELTASVLSRKYVTLKSEASHNNEIGLPLTLMHLTDEHERVVLEMGMYDVGEIADLARIARPHVGVVTNVGPVHLERAKTMERIVSAKQELVEALPAAMEGTAILNYDDERVRDMANATDARIFFYGLSPEADLWADDVEGLGWGGVKFRLHFRDETLHVKVPLLGRHSVHTALRATSVGLVEGLHWQEIIEGLQGLSGQLRLVAVPGPRGSTIVDDTYNASPASTIAALNLLEDLPGRRIAVLGDMLELGDYEHEGHEKVGMRAIEVVDLLITVGRRAETIGHTAVRWGMAPEHVHILARNEDVVALLEDTVADGDIVLVKGSRVLHMEDIVNALGRQ